MPHIFPGVGRDDGIGGYKADDYRLKSHLEPRPTLLLAHLALARILVALVVVVAVQSEWG